MEPSVKDEAVSAGLPAAAPAQKRAAPKPGQKKDSGLDPDTGLKFSRILPNVLNLNGKNVAGTFARSDKQGWWDKRVSDADYTWERAEKRRRLAVKEGQTVDHVRPLPDDTESAITRTLVVQPGTRWLRIGRATDDVPATIANCVARRTSSLVDASSSSFASRLVGQDASLEPKLEALRADLRNRYRAYKLRPEANGTADAKAYNAAAPIDEITEDPAAERLAWTDTTSAAPKAAFVGEAAMRIREPEQEGWTIRWPIEKGTFNTRGYASMNELLGDVSEVWLFALKNLLNIQAKDLGLYSVVFIIPDLYEASYLREMTDLILVTLGCKQVCFQQESLCAGFGNGFSSGCVIDMGARKTSVACIDDGLVLPESRITLDVGGDDMTELLYQLLLRIDFPYKEADLNRTYDWALFEYLKESVVVLSEGDVVPNVYNYDVRRPGKPLLKSSVQLFDEVIVSPLCIFAPRVVNFDRKNTAKPLLRAAAEDIDEILELGGGAVTNVMRNVTRHLAPPPVERYADPDAPPASRRDAPAAWTWVESAKTPLDVAVFESLCTLGTEDKIKRLVSSLIMVGGSSKIHNSAFALQSRLAVLFSSRFPNLVNQINVVLPPKNVDPRDIVWKGGALLAKLDATQDLWIRAGDWDRLGTRAIKERTLCCV